MKKSFKLMAASIISATLLGAGMISCGGSSGTGGSGSFTAANTLTVLNTKYTGNGNADVNFTANKADGSAILASILTKDIKGLRLALNKIFIPDLQADAGGLSCKITTPASGSSCTVTNITSTPGKAGTGGTIATAVDIDNTSSMSGNDPSDIRKPAAQEFIKVLGAANNKNIVSVFDFYSGISATAPFVDSRMNAEWTVLADATAITNVQNKVVAELGGSTNLFDSVFEICEDMGATHPAKAVSKSDTIDGVTVKTMLILTDGEDNSSTKTVTDVVNCLKNNNIVAYTVGLSPGGAIGADGKKALQDIADAKGGIYVETDNAAALTPIFQAIAGATTSGFNTATISVSPIPASGDTIEGELSNSAGAKSTFRFVVP
ncbi:MAG: VWA domain-containing protein [Deltaproteobacteria bacterium]|nr:VWA domain-containing protein [Deltaproteobacteria bacterium]